MAFPLTFGRMLTRKFQFQDKVTICLNKDQPTPIYPFTSLGEDGFKSADGISCEKQLIPERKYGDEKCLPTEIQHLSFLANLDQHRHTE